MAVGTTISLNKDAWVQLTNDAEDFVIQNVGGSVAIIKFSVAEPSADAQGHHCKVDEGISSNIFGQGVTWGRSLVGTFVEVTK